MQEIKGLDDTSNRGINCGATNSVIEEINFGNQLRFLGAEFGTFFRLGMIGLSDTGLQLYDTITLIQQLNIRHSPTRRKD